MIGDVGNFVILMSEGFVWNYGEHVLKSVRVDCNMRPANKNETDTIYKEDKGTRTPPAAAKCV